MVPTTLIFRYYFSHSQISRNKFIPTFHSQLWRQYLNHHQTPFLNQLAKFSSELESLLTKSFQLQNFLLFVSNSVTWNFISWHQDPLAEHKNMFSLYPVGLYLRFSPAYNDYVSSWMTFSDIHHLQLWSLVHLELHSTPISVRWTLWMSSID